DENGYAQLMARAENALGEIVGYQAFVIVGENQGIEMFERGEQGAQDALFGFRPKRLAALAVDAHDLLMARDDARFHGGHATRVREHAFVNDAGVAQTFAQGRARFVIPDNAEALPGCPEGAQFCGYVASPAKAFALLNEIDNRDGGLR